MNIESGIKLIKEYEGLRLTAYKDAVGVPTIGYGHTSGVRMGDKITKDIAEQLLEDDLAPVMLKLSSYNSIYKWNINEYNALLSFGYNLGSGAIDQVTNKGKRSKNEIAEKMLLYYNAGGKKLDGLVKRRKAEHDLFIKSSEEVSFNEDTTLGQIVDLIYSGYFGNGEDRKNKLYNMIQNLVNERSKKK
jgi:lysozyme